MADYRAYAQASRQSRAVVASTCAFLAYTDAHQVENIYKDELYQDFVLSITYYIQILCQVCEFCVIGLFVFTDFVLKRFHCTYKVITLFSF